MEPQNNKNGQYTDDLPIEERRIEFTPISPERAREIRKMRETLEVSLESLCGELHLRQKKKIV